MPNIPLNELKKKIQSLEARLNKSPDKKGARVMSRLDESPNTYFLRRPSGIMPLDIHTGGGLPAGGLTYLSGPDGAGKTFLLYKYFAMNQKLYGDKSAIALAATEAAPDHFFMRKCGMQIAIPEQMIAERVTERKLRGLPPFTKEELKSFRAPTVGEVRLILGSTGEEVLEGLLQAFETTAFDILGLDSVSACLPAAEKQKDLDDAAKRAAAASLLTRFFQHYLNGTTGYYGQNPTTVIFTSQVRANPAKSKPGHSAMWEPDYAPVGAWAAKHGKLIDILVTPGRKEREEVESTPVTSLGEAAGRYKRKVQTGKTVHYEVTKGKAGIHEGIAGEFDFNFANTPEQMRDDSFRLTDDQRTVVMEGMRIGIVNNDGGFLTFHGPDGKPYANVTKIAGAERLADMMRADFDLELQLRRAVLSAAGIECTYR